MTATLPYVLLSLVLLSSLLMAQQGARLTEVLENTGAPLSLALKLVWVTLPNVLVFTIPMAILTGTIMGFGRMNGDSELIIFQATGAGRGKPLAAMLVIGVLASVLAFYMGFVAGPTAARNLKNTVLEAARERFSSMITPGTFETSVQGKIVYVRDTDKERGEWRNVFIREELGGGKVRLITARAGRIDKTSVVNNRVNNSEVNAAKPLTDAAELVLTEARAVTMPDEFQSDWLEGKSSQVVIENLAQLRLKLDTGFTALWAKMESGALSLDELGFKDLLERSRRAPNAVQRMEAQIILYRRCALCLAPLLFALLGASAGIQLRRGGKGFGAILAAAIIVAYYLATLAAEQTARAGIFTPGIAMSLPSILVLCVALLLLATRAQGVPQFLSWKGNSASSTHADSLTTAQIFKGEKGRASQTLNESSLGELLARRRPYKVLTNIIDRDIFLSLVKYFTLSLSGLLLMFIVFTLFDLWRFIITNDIDFRSVQLYVLYLQPLLLVALAPAAIFIAVLLVFTNMKQHNEYVAWLAAGQSIYRLMFIGFLFAVCVGVGLWFVQDNVMPRANARQDALRNFIKNRVVTYQTATRNWVAEDEQILAFTSAGADEKIVKPMLYKFDADKLHLRSILTAEEGSWDENGVKFYQVKTMSISKESYEIKSSTALKMDGLSSEIFIKQSLNKDSHLTMKQLNQLAKANFHTDKGRELQIAAARRYTKAFEPLVLTLIATGLALSAERLKRFKSLLLAVLSAAMFWLFIESSALLGIHGMLQIQAAAWLPLLVFGGAGAYMISRQKT